MKSQHSFEEDLPMKQKLLSVLSALLSLCLMLFCPESLAENREVYASQGGAAFFRESGKIGLQAEDGTVLHPAEFDGAAYFDETQQASIYTEEGIGRIDRTGKVVIAPFPCDSIRAIPTRSEKAGDPAYLLLVSWYTKDGQEMMRLMTVDGQWLGDVQFDLMMNDFTNGRMFIRLFDEYNQIDAQGNLTAEDWWLQLTVNSLTGACALESTGDYLYFDTQGYLPGPGKARRRKAKSKRSCSAGNMLPGCRRAGPAWNGSVTGTQPTGKTISGVWPARMTKQC